MLNLLKISIVFVCLLLISCGANKKPANTKNQITSNTYNDSSSITKNPDKDLEKTGLDIMQTENIGVLKYGLSLSSAKKTLGEPSKKSKTVLWDADGEYHQTYYYASNGIELDIIGNNETGKTVDMLTITEPCSFKTSKNIAIGSSYREVQSAYKDQIDPDNSNQESIVVGSIYGGLIFKFKDQKVTSIFIGASAE